MGYGGTNGGSGGGPGGDPKSNVHRSAVGQSRQPRTTITKDVGYVARETNSNQILAIAGTDSDTVTTADAPVGVRIQNTGSFPVVVMTGYSSYTDEDTAANTVFLHTLLLPNESMTPNMRGIISTQGSNTTSTHGSFADRSLWNLAHADDVVDFTAPNTALKVDIGDNVNGTELANTTDPVVFQLDNGHEKYRVGDYIRIDDTAVEILKVEGTYDDNPTSETVDNDHIVVSRGHFGTSPASHSGSSADLYWPLFNEHYDYDRALSGSSQLVQTDSLGRYRSCNFFGYGRDNSGTSPFGLVPGSIAIRFYSKAYQEVTMGGSGADGGSGVSNIPITANTSSLLTASTAYAFNITIDDSSATTISFTTDSDSVKFGGSQGIVNKIQSAINTATRTAGNALFGYNCTVAIVNGALRFTSDSHLAPHDGTNGSKILLADAGSGTNVFSGSAGIFPDIAMANDPVEPKLPDLNVYDPITYATSRNMVNICYDDSYGNLVGAASGSINYETGYIDMVNAPKNAQWEVSCIENSPFSGKLDANKADANTLKSVHANVLSKNMVGKIKVETW